MDQGFETQALKGSKTISSDNKSMGPSSSSKHPTTNRYIDEIAAFNEDGFEKSIIDSDAKHILQDPGLRLTRRFSRGVTRFVRNESLSPLKPVLGAVDEHVDASDSDDSEYCPSNDSTNEDAASEVICFDESEGPVEAGRVENKSWSSSKDQNTSLIKPNLKIAAKGNIVAPTSALAQWVRCNERKGKYSTEAKSRWQDPVTAWYVSPQG